MSESRTAEHCRAGVEHECPAQHVPYGFYVLIWLALLALTQLTVAAGQFHLGALGRVIAVVVTPAKALLVLFFFMHLRYEKPVFRYMVIFTIVSLVTAIGFTFADYSFR